MLLYLLFLLVHHAAVRLQFLLLLAALLLHYLRELTGVLEIVILYLELLKLVPHFLYQNDLLVVLEFPVLLSLAALVKKQLRLSKFLLQLCVFFLDDLQL